MTSFPYKSCCGAAWISCGHIILLLIEPRMIAFAREIKVRRLCLFDTQRFCLFGGFKIVRKSLCLCSFQERVKNLHMGRRIMAGTAAQKEFLSLSGKSFCPEAWKRKYRATYWAASYRPGLATPGNWVQTQLVLTLPMQRPSELESRDGHWSACSRKVWSCSVLQISEQREYTRLDWDRLNYFHFIHSVSYSAFQRSHPLRENFGHNGRPR